MFDEDEEIEVALRQAWAAIEHLRSFAPDDYLRGAASETMNEIARLLKRFSERELDRDRRGDDVDAAYDNYVARLEEERS